MKWFFDKILNDNRGFVGDADDDEDDDKIKDDDVLDEGDDDGDDGEDDDVVIDLDEEDDDGKKKSPDNKAFAAMRVENKDLNKTVDDLKKTVEGLKPADDITPAYVPPANDGKYDLNKPRTWTEAQWDDLAKKDWKKAVDLRSKIQAEDGIAASTQTTEFNKVLEESKQTVLKRHPELNDSTSEKAKIYRNIVVSNPEYTRQKKVPLTAMVEMEEYMEKNMGYKREDIIKAELQARQDESDRHSRVQLTSTTGRNVSEGNKIVIGKDELEFCKLQGIDPKVYAANKKRLEKAGKGGIQL